MNAFEILIWALATLLISRIVRGADPRLWLAVGSLLGIGFELKHTIVVFIAGACVGLVATRARKILGSRWLWMGAGLAFLIALPNLLWQLSHDFVSLEFYRQATAKKNIALSPLGVLGQQLLVLHPLLVPIWGAGAIGLLAAPRFREQRWLGVGWWTLLVLLMISGASRPDRITGFAPALFAAGSIVWESWITRRIARAVSAIYVVIAGLLLAPINLPLLSFETTARYAAFTHAVPKIERGKSSPLPQWLADRTGWEAYAAQIKSIFAALSPEERQRARLFAPDYGRAGAIEHFIPELSVICPHNSYWDFSRGHTDSEIYIVVDFDEKILRDNFDQVARVGTTSCTYCMSWRSGNPIWLVRGSRVPLSTRWNELKDYE